MVYVRLYHRNKANEKYVKRKETEESVRIEQLYAQHTIECLADIMKTAPRSNFEVPNTSKRKPPVSACKYPHSSAASPWQTP